VEEYTNSAKPGRLQYRLPADRAGDHWRSRSRDADAAGLSEAGPSDSLCRVGHDGGRGLSITTNLQKKTAADIRGGCRGLEQPPEFAGW